MDSTDNVCNLIESIIFLYSFLISGRPIKPIQVLCIRKYHYIDTISIFVLYYLPMYMVFFLFPYAWYRLNYPTTYTVPAAHRFNKTLTFY